jgi:lipoprotein-releasing system permease protein
MEALDIITIAFAAIFISLVATLYPSRKAAGLDPAEALRYE